MKNEKYYVDVHSDSLLGEEINGYGFRTSSMRKIRKSYKALLKDTWQQSIDVCDSRTGEVLLTYSKRSQTYISNAFIKEARKILK